MSNWMHKAEVYSTEANLDVFVDLDNALRFRFDVYERETGRRTHKTIDFSKKG